MQTQHLTPRHAWAKKHHPALPHSWHATRLACQPQNRPTAHTIRWAQHVVPGRAAGSQDSHVVRAQSSPATGTVVKQPGTDREIRWGSALSRQPEMSAAMDDAIACILSSLGSDTKPDMALVFASSLHGDTFEHVVPMLRERIPSLRIIFGCSGFGVAGGSEDGPLEVEGEHAFSLTLGQLPGTTFKVLHTLRSSIPDEDASPEDWAQFVGVPHESTKPTSFIVFADPRFLQVRDLIAGLDYAFPDAHKIGSILSSGTRSKSRAMWAWSASGPANASTTSSSTSVSRSRFSRPGTNPLRGTRRSRNSDVLGSVTPKEMAAAVMAVMGKPADEDPIKDAPASSRTQESGTDSNSDTPSTSARSAGSSGPPDVIQLSSGASKPTSGSTEPADSAGQGEKQQQGFLGSLLNLVGGKGKKSGGPAAGVAGGGGSEGRQALQAIRDSLMSPTRQQQQQAQSGSQRSGSASGSQSAANDVPTNGMYMYGAIVLAMQGDVQMDVITSMGYRAPSPRVWRIEAVSSSNHIVTVVPEDLAMEAAQAGTGRAGNSSSSGRSRLMNRELGSDSDSDGEDEGGPEVQAIAAVVDMLEALTENEDEAMDVIQGWDELLDTAVVAVAADNSKPVSELGPEDWELLPLEEIVEEYGILVVGDPPVVGGGVDLRKGNRIQLLVRDPRGVREDLRQRLLDYKRRDLGSMLAGRTLPPTFGALLLTDVDRGMDCYERPNFESETTHQYVPSPISGVFGGAQIAPLQSSARATAILEYSAVVGVLRAAADKGQEAVRAETAARLEASKPPDDQEQQQ